MQILQFIVICMLFVHSTDAFLEGLLKLVGVEWSHTAKSATKSMLDKELPPAPLYSEEEFNEVMRSSFDLINAGNAKAGVEQLLTALESNPNHAEANKAIGLTLLKDMDRPDLAEEFLFRAVSSSEWTDIVSISQLVVTLVRNKDNALAEKVALEGMRRNKDGNEFYDKMTCQDILGQVLGVVFAMTGAYAKASEWYLSAALAGSTRLGDRAHNENVWLKASTLQFPREHFIPNLAKNTLLEALRFHPLNPVLVYNMGVATHLEGKDIESAAKLYQQALELDAEALREAESSENGVAASAITSIPDAWASLGTALFAMGKLQEAHDCFDRAMVIQPDNHIMLANWAKLLCLPEVGYVNEGIQLVERALKIAPANADVNAAADLCAVKKEEL